MSSLATDLAVSAKYSSIQIKQCVDQDGDQDKGNNRQDQDSENTVLRPYHDETERVCWVRLPINKLKFTIYMKKN